MSTLAQLAAFAGWLVAWPAAYSSLSIKARALIKKDELEGKKSVTETYYWLQSMPSAFGLVKKIVSFGGDQHVRRILMEAVRRAPIALLISIWSAAVISGVLEFWAMTTYEQILGCLLQFEPGQTAEGGSETTSQTVYILLFRYIVMSVATLGIDVAQSMLSEQLSIRTTQAMRMDILKAIFSTPAEMLDKYDAGELERISNAGPAAVRQIAILPGELVQCIVLIIAGMSTMLRSDWRLCAVVLLMRLPSMLNLEDKTRQVRTLQMRLADELSDSTKGQVHDTITQLRLVQVATAEPVEAARYETALWKSLRSREIMTVAASLFSLVNPLVRWATDAAWLVFGSYRVLSGGMALSAFLSFRGYRMTVTGNLDHLQWRMRFVEKNAEDAAKFFALLDPHEERTAKQRAADAAADLPSGKAGAAAASTAWTVPAAFAGASGATLAVASAAAAASASTSVAATSESSAAAGFASPRGAGTRSKPLPAAGAATPSQPPLLATAESVSGAPAPLALSRAPSEPVARPTLALARSSSGAADASAADAGGSASTAAESVSASSAGLASEPGAVPILPPHLARAASSESAASGASGATGLSSGSSLTHVSPSLMRALSSPTRPAAGPRGLMRQPSRQLHNRMRGDIELGNVWFKYAERGKAGSDAGAGASGSKAAEPAKPSAVTAGAAAAAGGAGASGAGAGAGAAESAASAPTAADPLASFILKGVSCSFPAGSVTALVGASGGGKTSILRLLLGVYSANAPPAGHDAEPSFVRIDGVEVAKWRPFDLRRQVAYIDQEATLLNRSIRENLQLGLPDDEQPSEAEMVRACKAAHIYDTIAAFPAGLDTLVGDRGVKLSSGERQRIAIARAFLRDPAVVLADEITANLDAISELKVKDGLHELMKGRTVITVAHRLSMAMLADQILVCEGGRIVESGTVDELLAPGSGSRFARLVECQALT